MPAESSGCVAQVGAEIVRKALSYPLRLIANNAGVNGSVVQQRVLENLDQSIGYNAATDKYEDLMAAGIIDPTKVSCLDVPDDLLPERSAAGFVAGLSSHRQHAHDITELEAASAERCGALLFAGRYGAIALERCGMRMRWPVQVLRVAMLNAASVARTFLTSDVIITEIPQPEAAAAAGGGMEGMGGY